jgi:hypothetical protein
LIVEHPIDPMLEIVQHLGQPRGLLLAEGMQDAGGKDRFGDLLDLLDAGSLDAARPHRPAICRSRWRRTDVRRRGALAGSARSGGIRAPAVTPARAWAMVRAISRSSIRTSCWACLARSSTTAASMRAIAASTSLVSQLRLRRAYSSRNQRPRAVAVIAVQMAS